MPAAAVKLRPIPDECRRQTHQISEKKRAINAPLANESDWRSSQSRTGDVELVSVIISLALGVPAHTETQSETTASCKHERRMNGCAYTSLCWGSSFLSLVCLLTPVVKYVYVRFWILVRKLVMLISHCVPQRHQGDSSRKGGMFLCKWRLNGAATRKRLGELRRYAASVGGSEVDFCICVCEWGEEEGCTCVSGLRWIVNSTDGHLEQLCALQQTHTHSHSHARL